MDALQIVKLSVDKQLFAKVTVRFRIRVRVRVKVRERVKFRVSR